MAYRILSLDGGGSWALIEAIALGRLVGPDAPGHYVLSQFDMVAANSGGSIVLACLLENRTPGQILGFFEDQEQRDSIFTKTQNVGYRLAGSSGVVPRYSTERKLPALRAALPSMGNQCLEGITADICNQRTGKPVHLIITSFDYDRNRATFFRSAAVSDPAWGTGAAAGVTLVEAVHASSTAPVKYFDAPATFPNNTSRYWDGGVTGCNNPVLAAVAEAVGLQVSPEEIVALSLGTGALVRPPAGPEESSPLFAIHEDPGLLADLSKLAESILDDPPDIASFLAHVMTGSGIGVVATMPNGEPIRSRIVRMNPMIAPVNVNGRWTTPGGMSIENFESLTKLTLDAIKQDEVEAINHYADLWITNAAPNQPVRLNGTTLAPELGQGWFGDALAAWQALSSQ